MGRAKKQKRLSIQEKDKLGLSSRVGKTAGLDRVAGSVPYASSWGKVGKKEKFSEGNLSLVKEWGCKWGKRNRTKEVQLS